MLRNIIYILSVRISRYSLTRRILLVVRNICENFEHVKSNVKFIHFMIDYIQLQYKYIFSYIHAMYTNLNVNSNF